MAICTRMVGRDWACPKAVQTRIYEFPKFVILSEAKDLRRYLGLNCSRVVFNEDMGENRESAWEKDKFVGRSFASLRMTVFSYVSANNSRSQR
jgi:hypothetical protein